VLTAFSIDRAGYVNGRLAGAQGFARAIGPVLAVGLASVFGYGAMFGALAGTVASLAVAWTVTVDKSKCARSRATMLGRNVLRPPPTLTPRRKATTATHGLSATDHIRQDRTGFGRVWSICAMATDQRNSEPRSRTVPSSALIPSVLP
jgi:hypothetical protein